MKNEIILRDILYGDPTLEASLHSKKQQLFSAMEIQGKQDGIQNRPKTLNEYKAHALLQIEAGIQSCIGFIQQAYQPVSGIGKAKIIEQDANKREVEVRNALHDDERRLQAAESEAESSKPDVKLMQIRKWVLLGLICIAAFEGWSSFMPFRYAKFPVLLAFSASVGVAMGAFLAAHHLGGWIKKAKDKKIFIIRYCIALVPSIVGFAYLGYLRAHAFSLKITPGIREQAETVQRNVTISALAITLVSILLFWIALFVSILFYRTEKERLREEVYESKRKEITKFNENIKEKESLIQQIRKQKIEQMALAFAKYEYAVIQEKLLIVCAYELAEKYKQQNLRNRTDGLCPECFSEKPQFNFTTFFNTVQLQHT